MTLIAFLLLGGEGSASKADFARHITNEAHGDEFKHDDAISPEPNFCRRVDRRKIFNGFLTVMKSTTDRIHC